MTMRLMPGVLRVTTSVEQHFAQVSAALAEIPSESVEHIVQAIVLAHAGGRHIYILGNGGSASTATHFACDLSKATLVAGRSRLKVTSLGDNVALLTAWANDTSYDRVYAEPLMNLLEPDDIVIAISASGNSPNVVEAIKVASELGALTVGLVGFDGGRLKGMVDLKVQVKSHDYGVVEDCHLVLQHAITASVKATLLA
jgi:D-sedoheptulose 7-phosphate isomerase